MIARFLPEDKAMAFVHSAHSGRSEPPLHRFNRLRLAPYAHIVTAFAPLDCDYVIRIVALNH